MEIIILIFGKNYNAFFQKRKKYTILNWNVSKIKQKLNKLKW